MIFFMVTMAINWVIGKWMKKSIYNPRDTISSISSGMTNNVKKHSQTFGCHNQLSMDV